MKMFKKLCISLSGSIDSLVDRLQNHEALAVASLSELEEKIRGARVSQAELGRALKRTGDDMSSARESAIKWRERAMERGIVGDREAALECLQRVHQEEERAASLEKQMETSRASHARLQQTITEMRNAHSVLSLRLRELRLRQQCEGFDAGSQLLSAAEAEQTLNRWEDSLGGTLERPDIDIFEQPFRQREDRLRLENELTALLQNSAVR